MRPSGEMAQASVKISDAPPTARLPRWTRCQSLAKPSVLEYWHMGETTMRLRSRMSRICNGSNRFMAIGCRVRGKVAGDEGGFVLAMQVGVARYEATAPTRLPRSCREMRKTQPRVRRENLKRGALARVAVPRKRSTASRQKSSNQEIGVLRQRRLAADTRLPT